jgi:3'-phosphoadenosine 5'-phosphosulfate sulfotransferase
MTLPTELKKPSQNLKDYSLIFAGTKKCGKTSLAVQWPKHYMMECEPGNALHLEANYDDIYSWDQILEKTKDIKQNPGYCQTLIVDDVPSAYFYCLQSVRKELGLQVNDPDNFTVWGTTKKKFMNWLLDLRQLGIGLIFTAHTDVKEYVDAGNGRKIHKLETTMSNQCNEMMDAIGVIWGVILVAESGERFMVIEETPFIKAGCGFTDHFLWQGNRIKEIPLGYNPKQAYANFLMAFHNQLEPKGSALKGGKVELLTVPKVEGKR